MNFHSFVKGDIMEIKLKGLDVPKNPIMPLMEYIQHSNTFLQAYYIFQQ